MATLEEREALRLTILRALYDQDEDSGLRSRMDYRAWASREGYDDGEVGKATRWLVDHGLADFPTLGPFVEITSAGIDAVEESMRPPEPADGGSLLLESVSLAEIRRLEPALAEIRTLLYERGDEMERDDREDLAAQLDTIDAQTRSPRPRKGVIGYALVAILFVLTAAAEAMVGQATIEALREIATAFGTS
ncbi:MAG: hypothetical protein KF703_15675 [Actinobacteria bacterium]|nr:hypothetical protein [Actinomycetota bacterium]